MLFARNAEDPKQTAIQDGTERMGTTQEI